MKKKFVTFRKEVARVTQEAMATRLGITTGAVGSWEKRGSEPTGKILWQLIKEFKLNPDWLYYDIGEPLMKDTTAAQTNTAALSSHSLKVDLGSISIPIDQLEHVLSELKELTTKIEEIKKSLNQ